MATYSEINLNINLKQFLKRGIVTIPVFKSQNVYQYISFTNEFAKVSNVFVILTGIRTMIKNRGECLLGILALRMQGWGVLTGPTNSLEEIMMQTSSTNGFSGNTL